MLQRSLIALAGVSRKENIAKHGVSLSRAAELEILKFMPDERHDYGESFALAYGLIDGEAHCLVFTIRGGKIRAISLRRAHGREMKRHADQD